MKRLVSAAVAALCLLAASRQQASAWSCFKLSFGCYLSSEQGGDNNCLWGVNKNRDLTGWPTRGFQTRPNPNFQSYHGGSDSGYGPPVYISTPGLQASDARPVAPSAALPPTKIQPAVQDGFMPIGYWTPNGGYYRSPTNSYYQAPSSGYYQGPTNWYGD
jgi:hypothetical protein